MNLKQRIEVLVELGDYLSEKKFELESVIQRAYLENAWFVPENTRGAILAIRQHFLLKDLLAKWARSYDISDMMQPKTVGLIFAGNIPLVGFHDLLTVFMSGHYVQMKLSDKDKVLMGYVIDFLSEKTRDFGPYFTVVDTLHDYDAVIATGSNNTSRYFESYFSQVPNIIRKNRNSIAVLTGEETMDDLRGLGEDVFSYFGLGCRNVSKLYVPRGYSFDNLLTTLHEYKEIILHNKYKNNFDYSMTIYLMNQVPFLNNGCIILTEHPDMTSRIATLHYAYYDQLSDLQDHLNAVTDQIQCVVSKPKLDHLPWVPFGQSQFPQLDDYADGVDTMEFLLSGMSGVF